MTADPVLSDDGLLPWEQRFAAGIARGENYTQAYLRARNLKNKPNQSLHIRASRAAADERIKLAVTSFLRAAKIHELYSIGQFHADLSRVFAKAEAAENWTACAALLRLQGQTVNALDQKINLTVTQGASDAELVKALAGDDKELAEMLAKSLPSDYVQ